jgi:hypothetical protein
MWGAGLLTRWRAVTNVASVTVAGDGVTAMVVEHWCYAVRAAWTTVVPMTRLPARQDRPALEQEVASPSVPYSR